jgi:alcohol dehydrogenase (NADP+)
MITRAYAAMTANTPLVPYTFERRLLRSHDVALEIKYSGICHSDIHQTREEWGSAIFPMVPGHEIFGEVKQIGAEVTKFSVGDRIGVGVFIDSCGHCLPCLKGLENYCEEGLTTTYNAIERDHKTVALGGYSNNFVVNEKYAVKIPNNLNAIGIAPLLCAGITVYSPLKHWEATAGQKVGIIGFGGLGHMAVKIAKALGCEVSVFSHSAKKESDAKAMGANEFVDSLSLDEFSRKSPNFDLILNTSAASMNLNPYLQMLKLDGALIMVGLSGKPYPIDAWSLVNPRRSIGGSMIGGIPELQEMMNFCGQNNIVSEVEVIDAAYINKAYERTIASDVKYRFVIDASTF